MKRNPNILKQIVCLLLLVQVINLSVDVRPPLNPYTEERDLSFNNIDSMLEFITEDVLGWKNFIKENNVPYQNLNLQKAPTFLPNQSFAKIILQAVPTHIRKLNPFIAVNFKSEFVREIIPPPPKA